MFEALRLIGRRNCNLFQINKWTFGDSLPPRLRAQHCRRFLHSPRLLHSQFALDDTSVQALIKKFQEISPQRPRDSSRMNGIVAAIDEIRQELKDLEAMAQGWCVLSAILIC